MSELHRFRVRHADDNEVLLEVDPAILTPEMATEINTFWGGAARRLADQHGDVVQTVVRMFGARAIFYMQADRGADLVETDQRGGEQWTKLILESEAEGWPSFEQLGIRIVSAYVEACDYDGVELLISP